MHTENNDGITTHSASDTVEAGMAPEHPPAEEIGGMNGQEPTRYGDWEKNGRCIDF